ncbi:hypothetical protein CVT25_004146 [Psilocybe cyanescens]|uniref:Uncharacterized protein n=1 Tax=Psilocybe cyanescens TaxID=93625 RepID=A0A409XKS7_PSICY|nr:hypothetical protein CVT25_004146 [Psilocybe cyanescens]
MPMSEMHREKNVWNNLSQVMVSLFLTYCRFRSSASLSNTFPYLKSTPAGKEESVTRALYMLGHVTSPWNPVRDISLKDRPSNAGLSIGDIGWRNKEDNFVYCFNILQPPSNTMQNFCPPNMELFSTPPGPADIQINSRHFPPGTTVIIKGVAMTSHFGSPL